MIVISGALVLVALILLVIGLVGTSLGYVYASIVVSLLSFVFLVLGIIQRRKPGAAGAAGAIGDGPLAAGVGAIARGLSPDEEPAVTTLSGDYVPPAAPGAASEGSAETAGYVLVVAGRPRYHVEGCRYLTGKDPQSMTVEEARKDFSACGVCKPDSNLTVETAAPTLTLVKSPVEAELEGFEVEPEPDEVPEEATVVVPRPARKAAAPAKARVAATQAPARTPRVAKAAPVDVTPPVETEAVEAAPVDVPAPVEKAASKKAAAKRATPAPPVATPIKAPAKKAAPAKTSVVADLPTAPAGPAVAPKKKAAATKAAPAAPAPVVTKAPAKAPVKAPAKAPAKAPVKAPVKAAAKKGGVFVIPDRGKYHTSECRYVRGADDVVELPRAAATKQGYTACGVCNP